MKLASFVRKTLQISLEKMLEVFFFYQKAIVQQDHDFYLKLI